METPITTPKLAVEAFKAQGINVNRDSLKIVRLRVNEGFHIPLVRASNLNGALVYVRIDTGEYIERWSRKYKDLREVDVCFSQGFQIGHLYLTLSESKHGWELKRVEPKGSLWVVNR